MYNLKFLTEAVDDLEKLKKHCQNAKRKKIRLALDKLRENPRHPGLHTHKNSSFKAKSGEEIFQSYVENRTPGAYRIFWAYGKDNTIIILAITPHP
jgi:hypothetical protein